MICAKKSNKWREGMVKSGAYYYIIMWPMNDVWVIQKRGASHIDSSLMPHCLGAVMVRFLHVDSPPMDLPFPQPSAMDLFRWHRVGCGSGGETGPRNDNPMEGWQKDVYLVSVGIETRGLFFSSFFSLSLSLFLSFFLFLSLYMHIYTIYEFVSQSSPVAHSCGRSSRPKIL